MFQQQTLLPVPADARNDAFNLGWCQGRPTNRVVGERLNSTQGGHRRNRDREAAFAPKLPIMIVPTDGRTGHSIWRAVVQGVYERQQRASYHVALSGARSKID